MSPSPYLLHVNSSPTAVSNALWKEWYTTEHVPDLVNSKSAIRGAFYEEIGFVMNPKPNNPRKFLALYQTDFEELLKSEEFKTLRTTSELFSKESARSNGIADNGNFDTKYYNLLQNYDPNNIGEREQTHACHQIQH